MAQESRKKKRLDALRSKDDLIERLWEQMNFLQSSASAFDRGDESEARRLSLTLRILLLHSKESKSLFEQLGLGRHLKMLNTADAINPKNLLPTLGLAAMQMSQNGGKYVAQLGNHPPIAGSQLIRLDRWLTQPIGKRLSHRWSRQDLISWVANRDGGAHVDSQLSQLHHGLSRENAMGMTFTTSDHGEPEPFKGDYVLACIRQIAYEVDMTVIRHADVGDIPRANNQ